MLCVVVLVVASAAAFPILYAIIVRESIPFHLSFTGIFIYFAGANQIKKNPPSHFELRSYVKYFNALLPLT